MVNEVPVSASENDGELLCAAMDALAHEPHPEPLRTKASELRRAFDSWKAALPEAQAAQWEVRFHHAEKNFNNLLLQRYEARDLERWEHYTLKCDICRELETLFQGDDASLRTTLPRLKVLHTHWHRLYSIPKEKTEELKVRYDAINKAWRDRLDRYFAELEGKRAEALVRKQAIVAEAQGMQESAQWNETADALKKLQEEWKAMPGAPDSHEKELYTQFRAACDTFFNARNVYFKEKRNHTLDAIASRSAVCEKLEQFDLEQPAETLKRFADECRREWRTLGSAGKQTAALLARFNLAMDKLYDRLRAGNMQALAERQAWAERFAALLEAAERDGEGADWALLNREARKPRQFERLPGTDRSATEKLEQELLRRYQELLQSFRRQQYVGALTAARQKTASGVGDLKRCRRLIQELERFAPAPRNPDEWSADDLQAAIEANFGAREVVLSAERVEAIVKEFLAAEPGEAEIDQFQRALERVYAKLGAN